MRRHIAELSVDLEAARLITYRSAWLRDEQRVEYTFCTDEEALKAFRFLSETEGIIPAMESAHAIAEAMKLAPTLRPEQTIIVNLSGRGDKDVQQVAAMLGL